MRLKRAWLVLAALLSLGLVLAACGEEGPASPTPGATPGGPRQVKTDFGVTDTEIKIGHTNVLSGSLAAVYQPVTPALQAYFEYVNREKGGVCGRRITFIFEDSQYSPTVAREKVTKLIEQDRVLALVGDLGTPAVTGEVDYVNEQRVPLLYVSTGASKWGDYQRWPWTIGFIPDYVSEGRILGRFANERFPNAKVGILYQNDDFGLDGRNGFKQEFRGQIVAEQSYEATATDISSQMANLRAAGADLVYLYATPAFSARAFQYMQQNGGRGPRAPPGPAIRAARGALHPGRREPDLPGSGPTDRRGGGRPGPLPRASAPDRESPGGGRPPRRGPRAPPARGSRPALAERPLHLVRWTQGRGRAGLPPRDPGPRGHPAGMGMVSGSRGRALQGLPSPPLLNPGPQQCRATARSCPTMSRIPRPLDGSFPLA